MRITRIVKKRIYDVCIGLGSCCQTAYQLCRLGYRTKSMPFDWLVLTYESLYQLMEKRFDKFLNKEDLELHRGEYVLEKRYGIKLVHDFKCKKEFVWLEDYQHHYDKYQRRIKRFLELTQSGKRVLFVRRECSKEQAKKLVEMIGRVYPGMNFGLLVLDDTEEVKEHWGLPGVWNHYLMQEKPYKWKGIDAEWDRAMWWYQVHGL
jgi:hypothetical protein